MCIKCKICLPFFPTPRGAPPDSRGREVWWSNSPSWVRVALRDEEGKETAHVQVEVTFEGETKEGRFDCVAVAGAVEEDATARGETVAGLWGKDVGVQVECEGREVQGSYPNEKYLYQFGDCFRG